MIKLRTALVILILSMDGISAMRILAYFPSASKSHHRIIQPIIHELANRGHFITYATAFPLPQSHPNVSHHHLEDYTKFMSGKYNEAFFTSLTPMNTAYLLDELSEHVTPKLARSKPVQQLIHSKDSYDLILHGAFLCQEHAAVFTHKFNAHSVAIHPFGDAAWLNEISGLTDNPAFMMSFEVPLTDRMSFTERLYNSFILASTLFHGYYHLYKLQAIIDDVFVYDGWKTRPSIYQLVLNQSLILTASHHAVGYAFPKAPHVKEIGGLTLKERQPLPKELAEFVTGATDGVIYFSFGSLIRTEAVEHLRDVFLGVFSRLKQRVLLKWDSPIDNPPENVMISTWFPQQDILGHENAKLFVTHGGLQSSFETVYHGVPVVSIPFFSDQRKNAKLADSAGYGVMLNIDNITQQSFFWAIDEVIHNPRYKMEVKRRSLMLRDRPMKPLDEAVYWIEYVHRHGRVLQPAAIHLSFVELHLWDVCAFISVVVFLEVVIFKKIVSLTRKRIVRSLSGSDKISKSKKNK